MDMLVLATKGLLILLIIWSAVIMSSITKMIVTIRSIRGTTRRVDWIESGSVAAIFAGASWLLWKAPIEIDNICTFAPSFGVAALFLLFYITERHVQNIRNIRAIKKNLTKS